MDQGRAGTDGRGEYCRAFCSVPGPLQPVQRAEMWVVVLAIQAGAAVYVGVDTIPAKIITEMRGAEFIVFRIN